MKVGLNKKNVLILFIGCALMVLSFPFMPEATEIKIGEENMEEIEEEIEIIVEIIDGEEWEIVIIDEPLPVALPNFPQIETVEFLVESTEDIAPITVLPKTGELNSVSFSGLGAILIYVGVSASRKKLNKF